MHCQPNLENDKVSIPLLCKDVYCRVIESRRNDAFRHFATDNSRRELVTFFWQSYKIVERCDSIDTCIFVNFQAFFRTLYQWCLLYWSHVGNVDSTQPSHSSFPIIGNSLLGVFGSHINLYHYPTRRSSSTFPFPELGIWRGLRHGERGGGGKDRRKWAKFPLDLQVVPLR